VKERRSSAPCNKQGAFFSWRREAHGMRNELTRRKLLAEEEKKGRISAFAHQVRLVHGRFGTYEPIDFLALLIGYAISTQELMGLVIAHSECGKRVI
jgi:hypothetical protein